MSKSSSPSPFYHLVPKTYEANLLYRQKLWRSAASDPELQRQLWTACSRDILYWINTFCRIFEPRKSAVLPWITYEFQDKVVLEMQRAIRDGHDLAVAKTRDVGMSWMMIAVFDHFWIFGKWCRFMLVSRTEALVDKPNDSDSLMWKAQFLVDSLPQWMRPTLRNEDRTVLHYENPERHNVIDGAATTENLGRGGRRLAFGLDEFAAFSLSQGMGALASTQSNTDCRIFVSTPQGAFGAFYDRFHDTGLNTRRLKVHWSDHPLKRPGLYTSEGGRLKVLDPDYVFPKGYKFILDGRLRSVWYDNEWRRESNKVLLAQELDIDFVGSGNPFFSPERISSLAVEYGRDPIFCATLTQDYETLLGKSLVMEPGGLLRLWQPMMPDGKAIPGRSYCMGVDVATGSGASNSCFSIGDVTTKEKIAAFASSNIRPEGLADLAYGVGMWFNEAQIIWEANPVCRPFGDRLVELGYPNLYMRTADEDLTKTITQKAGWYSTPGGKMSAMAELRRAIESCEFIQHDVDAFQEYTRYIIGKNNKLEFVGGSMGIDRTGAASNHGDRVIADMLLWHLLKEHTAREKEMTPRIPENSFAGRRMAWERSQKPAKHNWWARHR